MKVMDNNTRFARKLENFLWWLLKLLPLIIFFILNIGFFTAKPIWQYFVDDGDWSDFFNHAISLLNCLESLGFSRKNFITAMLEDIFSDYLPFNVTAQLLTYFAYLIFIEILHFFYNFMVFIIRWANGLFERLFKN